jgi:Ribonuclease G/E
MTPREKDKKIVIAAHPAVVGHLYNRERQAMEALEKGHNKKIILQVDANFHIEHYDIYLL